MESCLELNGILQGVVAGKNVSPAIWERQIQTLMIFFFLSGTLKREHVLNVILL